MVEIFKTNVTNKRLAARVLKNLRTQLPAYCFNFDLEDCDRILRVQSDGAGVDIETIIGIVECSPVEICVFAD